MAVDFERVGDVAEREGVAGRFRNDERNLRLLLRAQTALVHGDIDIELGFAGDDQRQRDQDDSGTHLVSANQQRTQKHFDFPKFMFQLIRLKSLSIPKHNAW